MHVPCLNMCQSKTSEKICKFVFFPFKLSQNNLLILHFVEIFLLWKYPTLIVLSNLVGVGYKTIGMQDNRFRIHVS